MNTDIITPASGEVSSVPPLAALQSSIQKRFAEQAYIELPALTQELTVTVSPQNWLALARFLRDEQGFEQLIDLCGLDYLHYRNRQDDQPALDEARRFCVVVHLLSVQHNLRVRLRMYCASGRLPVAPSLVALYPSVNWFEREAFDLVGVVFEGHPDLRRILTDYGFIGHPLRRDFPVSGHIEMRYDPEQKRVIYQPVSIEPRETTPRIIRETGYGRTLA